MEQYMWKKKVIIIVITEMVKLNAGTCTRSRVIGASVSEPPLSDVTRDFVCTGCMVLYTANALPHLF